MSMAEAQRDLMIGHHHRRIAELEQENAWLLAKLVAIEALCDAAEAGLGTGIYGMDVSTSEIRAAFTTGTGQT